MPWVAVLVDKNDPNKTPLCWGSLINDRYFKKIQKTKF
jgi:hypothetical protein